MKAVCCSQCFEFIASHDHDAANLWLILCRFFTQNGPMGLREERVPEAVGCLRKLEEMHYVSTADGLDCVSIKVNGLLKFDLEETVYTYCIKREDHGHE